MSIKNTLTKAAEKITGRKCTRCLHNCGGRCCHPDGRMFMKCWQSITRPGFEKRPPRFLKYEDVTDPVQLKAAAQQRLKEIAQEAPKAKPPVCIDRDKEEYFRCECLCPECGTFLVAYTYGRAWTDNGVKEEYRPASCSNCGQEIDWSGVPYPAETLTPEEQYQLEKIKGVLQEAEDSARESGLLEG